jgi:ribonucleotide monophosphatase NagD (HAD superfamily)
MTKLYFLKKEKKKCSSMTNNSTNTNKHLTERKKRASIAFNDLLKGQVLLSGGVARLPRANIFLNFKIY